MSEQEQPSETEVELDINTVEDSAEAPIEDAVEQVLQEVTIETVQAELALALARVDEQQVDVLRAHLL